MHAAVMPQHTLGTINFGTRLGDLVGPTTFRSIAAEAADSWNGTWAEKFRPTTFRNIAAEAADSWNGTWANKIAGISDVARDVQAVSALATTRTGASMVAREVGAVSEIARRVRTISDLAHPHGLGASAFVRSAYDISVWSGAIGAVLQEAGLASFADTTRFASSGIAKLAATIAWAEHRGQWTSAHDFVGKHHAATARTIARGARCLAWSLEDLPSGIAAEIPSEIFRALDLDVSLPRAADDSVREERTEIDRATSDDLRSRLARLDPEFVHLLDGARASLDSKNPDRARHTCVSLRELLGHVLRRVASDDEIRSWSQDPRHYHNDSPTRQARLLYVYRTLEIRPLRNFVRWDVKAATELIDVLSNETHVVAQEVDDACLEILLSRVEGILLLVLKVAALPTD
jgi:hypothetical protein